MFDWYKGKSLSENDSAGFSKQCHAAADNAAVICFVQGRSAQIYSPFSKDFRATWNRSHKTVKFM